jgi:hypothetical protein
MKGTANFTLVEVTERYADGIIADEEFAVAAKAEVEAPVKFAAEVRPLLTCFFAARYEAYDVAKANGGDAPWDECREKVWSDARFVAMLAQAKLLREMIGNPFRPVALNSVWRTPDVLALAQTIYDDRAFERLPVLANALEEAGCHAADILGHCRSEGPHVRGCWVVDAVLGKA